MPSSDGDRKPNKKEIALRKKKQQHSKEWNGMAEIEDRIRERYRQSQLDQY